MLKLKELREDSGLLQKDLAKALHRTTTCICNWETGRTEPDLESLVKLADILDCTVDELLGRERPVEAWAKSGAEAEAEKERALLNLFRKYPQEVKEAFENLGEVIAKHLG